MTRTWLEDMVKTDHPQDSMDPRGPHPGPTAPRTMTATGRDSLGKCLLEVSLQTLMKVRVSVQALPRVTNISIPDEITASFRRFGPLVVDWPHKAESKSYFPPKGYAFLLFQV